MEYSGYFIQAGFSGRAQVFSGQCCLITLHRAGKQFCTHKEVLGYSHEIVTQIKGLSETVQFLMLFIDVNK